MKLHNGNPRTVRLFVVCRADNERYIRFGQLEAGVSVLIVEHLLAYNIVVRSNYCGIPVLPSHGSEDSRQFPRPGTFVVSFLEDIPDGPTNSVTYILPT